MIITFKLKEKSEHTFLIYKTWVTNKKNEPMLIGEYDDKLKLVDLTDPTTLTIDALQQIVTFSKH